MYKILIIHGPNLQLLGNRETDIYGDVSLEAINQGMKQQAELEGVELEIMQSNHEGEIVDIIGNVCKEEVDAILINPAAYTHTSVAIRDAIAAVNIPAVEIHLSNIYAREEFRHMSMSAPVCHGIISGFGVNSYYLGLKALIDLLHAQS